MSSSREHFPLSKERDINISEHLGLHPQASHPPSCAGPCWASPHSPASSWSAAGKVNFLCNPYRDLSILAETFSEMARNAGLISASACCVSWRESLNLSGTLAFWHCQENAWQIEMPQVTLSSCWTNPSHSSGIAEGVGRARTRVNF